MANAYMPLYTGDYLRDTAHLTTEEHGAYLLLLVALWNQGGAMKSEPKYLARVARMTPTRFRNMWPSLEDFFTIEGEQITHKRITSELRRVADISEKKSKAARAREERKRAKTGQKRSKNEKKPKSFSDKKHNKNNKTNTTGDAQPCHTQARGLGSSLQRRAQASGVAKPKKKLGKAHSDAAASAPARMSGGGLSAECEAELAALASRAQKAGGDNLAMVVARIAATAVGGGEGVIYLDRSWITHYGNQYGASKYLRENGFEIMPPPNLKAVK